MGLHTTRFWRDVCLTCASVLFIGGCFEDNHSVKSEPADTVTGHWETDYVRDYQYMEGRMFDLAYPGEIGPFDSVRVWVYRETYPEHNPDGEERYLDVGTMSATDMYDKAGVFMAYVEPDHFELLYGLDSSHCPVALVFYEEQGSSRALGVRMIIKRYSSMWTPTGEVDTIGYVGPEPDTLRILQPTLSANFPDHPAWQLMWRNCYRVRMNVEISDLRVKILKCPTGSEGADSCRDYQSVDNVAQGTFLEILGLDQFNLRAERIPDGLIDESVEIFRPDWGLIIFPEREPFNSNRTFEDAEGNWTDTLIAKRPKLYNYSSITEKMENSVYYLELRYWIREESGN